MATTFSALIGATRLYNRKNRAMWIKMSAILDDIYAEFGLKARLAAALGGRYLLRKMRREEERLARGWTYEPPTFYEKNFGFAGSDSEDPSGATPCPFVTPRVAACPLAAGSRVAEQEPAVVG